MTCRHCHEQIRLCDCVGARNDWPSVPHWVLDVAAARYPSRWCMPASLDRTHEPEVSQS